MPPGDALMQIDAHQHFWRVDRGDYGWLTPDAHPAIYRDFGPDDLAPLLAGGAASSAPCWCRPRRPRRRRTSCSSSPRATPFVAGVVGWVDFEAPDAADRIAGLAARSEAAWVFGPCSRIWTTTPGCLGPSVAPALRRHGRRQA